MAVDPVVKVLLDAMVAAETPLFEDMTPEEARNMPRQAIGPPEEVFAVEDRTVPGPVGAIPVRVYRPAAGETLPGVVYFHGGGFVIGDLESHDALCRALTNASGCVVVAVDYRLAPEHRFPAAADDCYAATAYIAAHAADFGMDPGRIAVAGDSAGGDLAAVVTQTARDRGGPHIRFQALIYPVTDFNFDRPSYRENVEGYFLTTAGMRWFWGHYLAEERDGASPQASPMRAASFADLPPALVITAEYDPLRDEGEAYAQALREAGVPVTLHRYDGMIHAFVSMFQLLPQGRAAIDECGAALRAALTPGPVTA